MKFLLCGAFLTIGFCIGIATMASVRPVVEYRPVRTEPAANLQLSCAQRDVIEYLRTCRQRTRSEAVRP